MRLKISKSKNSMSLYVIKSTYINSVNSSKIVEKLGTYDELKKKLKGKDPIKWAKEYIQELNEKDKEEKLDVIVKYSPTKVIEKDEQVSFNGGYLFLQQLYYKLGLDKISNEIAQKYKFTFDLNSILSRLLYSRIIFPSSKLGTYELSQNFIEQPNFELQHIYRALEVIAKESDFIQSSVYKNSLAVAKRNTSILYYDCTNYFFETTQPEGLKQYGKSKEHRPNPIVQMGLFIDADGMPLAFSIDKGNTNEQITLRPLEEKILSDFKHSRFIVCTDAGLSSYDNRKFNNKDDRAFITTQPIKKLKQHIQDWCLDSKDWLLAKEPRKKFDINSLDEVKYKDEIFYKERWINENGLEQRIVVSFSIKYRDYQRNIRNNQIERALKTIKSDKDKLKKYNANDYRRFIKKTSITDDGEVANKEVYCIDNSIVEAEEIYDGFYAVCTNLDGNVNDIIKINKQRWQIEECFRIMKSEFKSRPVYLTRDDRITAHFTTCFLALIIYRLIEKKLPLKNIETKEEYTCHEIIDTLRNMNFYNVKGDGYIPIYTRTDLTDALHETFGFRTDYEILNSKQLKKIIKSTKL